MRRLCMQSGLEAATEARVAAEASAAALEADRNTQQQVLHSHLLCKLPPINVALSQGTPAAACWQPCFHISHSLTAC